ncbi:uncharacterized protein isoform X2 [Leptinotarsa decemlineata]|uniref:uncharacterized protein isoform X2 n=1 Tax=Leptinotarsa decemlineata TaxID=7539 RepID=UPI000C25459B|nr:uncharacterized protein LOC111518011 isoform X2 [Leptinotarsa decemlineata]XP_023030085.1 uncharacterized protein LOC111518011 isoform X2 [Leptinotarsa decemlineata]
MGFELLLLCCLIFMFVVSFCGLLQKIKQSYEHERAVADRIARRHERNSSDSFVNTTYVDTESGIFPGAPPPYTHADPPPKYEDVIKSQVEVTINRVPLMVREPPSAPSNMAPPPYTITV